MHLFRPTLPLLYLDCVPIKNVVFVMRKRVNHVSSTHHTAESFSYNQHTYVQVIHERHRFILNSPKGKRMENMLRMSTENHTKVDILFCFI